MEIVVKPKNIYNLDKYIKMKANAFIFGIKDYCVNATSVVDVKTLSHIKNKLPKDIKLFVSIDKNIFNKDLEKLEKILLQLEKLNLDGILFYDVALLSLRDKLNIKTPFIWNQNFFVTNYKTINYYKDNLNVNSCVLSNEITIEEIEEISKNVDSNLFINAFGYQLMAFSKRKLITSYFKNIKGINMRKEHFLKDKNGSYMIKEEKDGTAFITGKITNYFSEIKSFKKLGVNYVILDEKNVPNYKFLKVIDIFYKEINDIKSDIKIEDLFDNLGTGFLHQKTIYKVK